MGEHGKKMIAPVVIAILFLAYLALYVFIIVMAAAPEPLVLLFAVPLAALGIGMIRVLISRIREIRSGEEDDLSNY